MLPPSAYRHVGTFHKGAYALPPQDSDGSRFFFEMMHQPRIFVRGAGEMATGIALALAAAGLPLPALQERPRPTAVRRGVCFSEAVHEGCWHVQGRTARHVMRAEDCPSCWRNGEIPVLTCSEADSLAVLRPDIFIEATLRKRPTPLGRELARLVLALGPGFTAGRDAHLVVETHPDFCGQALTSGQARAPQRTAADRGTNRRHLYAPEDGLFRTDIRLGEHRHCGQPVGFLHTAAGATALPAPMTGMLRGLLRDGTPVRRGVKLADMDDRPHITPYTPSTRAAALGQAVARLVRQWLQGEMHVSDRTPAPA